MDVNPSVPSSPDEPSSEARNDVADSKRQPDVRVTRWLFLRMLGVVFGIAFFSCWTQVEGLVGANGLLPADAFVAQARDALGVLAYWRFPSWFWLYPYGVTLHLVCATGVLASALLVAGIAARLSLLVLWTTYLSIVAVSQDFMSFQWDILLIETGFLAMFLAPGQWLPKLSREAPPSRLALWLLRFLLFRLMFTSGVVKLGDETWQSLSALAYHYGTQPLPTPVAWYLWHAPLWFNELSTLLVLAVELVVPFAVFAPRTLRLLGGMTLIAFQVLIMLTGNFGFFNWTAITLCVLLFDDDALRKVVPRGLAPLLTLAEAKRRPKRRWSRVVRGVAAAALATLGVLQFSRAVERHVDAPAAWSPLATGWLEYVAEPLAPIVGLVEPLRIVNPYGLFAFMTTTRPEIVIEGSNDGETWRPYEFKYKAGDAHRRPRWAAPHQPRLDWQMWFAALGEATQTKWFPALMVRLLQGEPPVLGLLGRNPFPEAPPVYVRATRYEYEFAAVGDDAWWTRRAIAPYYPEMALSQGFLVPSNHADGPVPNGSNPGDGT